MRKLSEKRTIYHLTGVPADLAGVLHVLSEAEQGIVGEAEFDELDFPGASVAAAIWGNTRIGKARWIADASPLVATPLDFDSPASGLLVIVVVDQEVYAIGFGDGHRLLPAELKDPTFGLRFAVRAIDADTVLEVSRRTLGGRGRADTTTVPTGIPIGQVGLSEYTELVRKLAGTVDLGGQTLAVEGSAGLRMRHPLVPADLVALLRRITAICTRDVLPELAFIEAIQPVQDTDLNDLLDMWLTECVLSKDADAHISLTLPTELLSAVEETRSYRIRFGRATLDPRPELDLATIQQRCRVHQSTALAEALRFSEVRMCSDREGTEVLGKAPVIEWLEATARLDGRDFFLMEGRWYEAGTRYFASIRQQIAYLFPESPSISLPAWKKGIGERCYNLKVQHDLGRASYLSLDRRGIRTTFHGSNGFEPCDLLGPANELIHVKAAKGSEPLSHQINQALISAEALLLSADARKSFAALVEETSDGTRSLPADFRPRKVVFAIMLKTGRTCSPETLFPFAQVALAHMARTLQHRFGLDIEVIAIEQA